MVVTYQETPPLAGGVFFAANDAVRSGKGILTPGQPVLSR
jgi:hypothetical protein